MQNLVDRDVEILEAVQSFDGDLAVAVAAISQSGVDLRVKR